MVLSFSSHEYRRQKEYVSFIVKGMFEYWLLSEVTGSSSARDIATCLVCHHIEETFRICSVLAYNVAETFNEYFSTTAEKLQNKIITNAQFLKKSPVMEQ